MTKAHPNKTHMKTALAWIIYAAGKTLFIVMCAALVLLLAWMAYDAIHRLGWGGVFSRAWPVALGMVAVGAAACLYVWASDRLGRD